MHEFNLIEEYFTWNNIPSDVALPVGDDAAVLNIPTGQQLVTSIDTLISGIHFPQDTPPHAIGHKALAVNLSDLAAMGATPKWFTLGLTLPEINKNWLDEFSRGLKELAQKHPCFLVGGDTTRGPLSISIQVMGVVDHGNSLLRSGAKAGDALFVTGNLGDAALGLHSPSNTFCKKRLDYPTPRLAESEIIKNVATSCIDVSDGLLQDLSHILTASKVAAVINLGSLPLSAALLDSEHKNKHSHNETLNFALNGGDDYELLFTVPPEKLAQLSEKLAGKITQIGIINKNINQNINQNDFKITDEKGNALTSKGYNHFHES